MILDRLDLDAAVAEGIISRDQAMRLHDLSLRERSAEDATIDFFQDTRDEPFRLLRGFRDFFIAIALAILAVGVTAIALKFIGNVSLARSEFLRMHEPSVGTTGIALILCGVGAVLAEIITRRQRLPLSSLVVTLAIALWGALLFGLIAVQISLAAIPYAAPNHQPAVWAVGWSAVGGAILGVTVFYCRYRLPFALFLLAGSAVGLSLLVIRDTMGGDWFADNGRILIGLSGGIIFAAAMWYDVRDRLRVTRLSECAFWLHLFAAPLLVHALLVEGHRGPPGLWYVLGTMGIMAVVALLIDRRALLVSGLSYLAVAISQIVSNAAFLRDLNFASTAFILGGIMLVLGLGWTPIRRFVLAALPFERFRSWLPPTAA